MENPPSREKILNLINFHYPSISWRKILSCKMLTYNFIYKLIDSSQKLYVLKIYRNFRPQKIKSEYKIMHSLTNLLPTMPQYIKNRNGNLASIDKKHNIAFAISSYIKGKGYKNGKLLTFNQIKTAAFNLADLHNFNIVNEFSYTKDICVMSLTDILKNGINVYQSVLRKIGNSSSANHDFDKIVYDVIQSRLSKAKKDLDYALNIFSKHKKSLIHGDYAPSNIVYNKDKLVLIVDWERVCIYSSEYDLFRAICNFASENNLTPYDSKKNFKKIATFLKYYFQKRIRITEPEIAILRLMPRYFCFLDPFVFKELYLNNRGWVKRYMPKSKIAYAWWQKNEQNFLDTMDKLL